MATLVITLLILGTLAVVLPDRRVRAPVRADQPRRPASRS
jgi:hypothetical protein